MILIFGGAHQGKLEFGKDMFRRRTGAAGRREEGGRCEDEEPNGAADRCEDAERHKEAKRVSEAGRPPVVFDCREFAKGAGGSAGSHSAGAHSAGADGASDGYESAAPDFGADIICGLEEFTWACCAQDPAQRREARDWMEARRDQWQDKILILRDVSQGIVPMDARTRAFREMNGRLMLYLAGEAEEVWRVFCGIGKRIR